MRLAARTARLKVSSVGPDCVARPSAFKGHPRVAISSSRVGLIDHLHCQCHTGVDVEGPYLNWGGPRCLFGARKGQRAYEDRVTASPPHVQDGKHEERDCQHSWYRRRRD